MLTNVYHSSGRMDKTLVTILDSVKNWGTEDEAKRDFAFHIMLFSTV